MSDIRIKELRTALAEKIALADAVTESAATGGDDGKTIVITAQHKTDFDAAMKAVMEIRSELTQLEGLKEARDYLAAPAAKGVAAELDAMLAFARNSNKGTKSLGAQFIESEAWKEFFGTGKATMARPFEVAVPDISQLGSKDVYSSLPTGTPGDFGTVQRDPIVLRQHRMFRIRDLFNVQQTSSPIVEFFQSTGFATNAASVVPERTGSAFALKPHTSLAFVGKQTTAKTIAHYEVAHRNTLNDEPQVRGIIDNELMYGLQLREDQQILYGNEAVNPNDLPGIMNEANIQTYARTESAASATDTKADDVRRAMTKAFLAEYQPTGVVVHPSDWEKMELIKDSTGGYILATSIANGGELKVWNTPVVQTPAITAGTALVGAFGLGSTLYDREQASVRVAEQHEDFFLRNAVAILAEERLLLATKRPEAFVKVTLGS